MGVNRGETVATLAGVGKLVLTALLAVPTLLLAGCSSTTRLKFACDPQVNGGLLLTIDLVEVNQAEAEQIRQIGDQWFYSDLRRQLGLRTRTIAVRGGCAESVELRRQKGYDVLVVISDYQFAAADTSKGHMQVFTKDQWRGKKLLVGIHDTYLTVTER